MLPKPPVLQDSKRGHLCNQSTELWCVFTTVTHSARAELSWAPASALCRTTTSSLTPDTAAPELLMGPAGLWGAGSCLSPQPLSIPASSHPAQEHSPHPASSSSAEPAQLPDPGRGTGSPVPGEAFPCSCSGSSGCSPSSSCFPSPGSPGVSRSQAAGSVQRLDPLACEAVVTFSSR